MSTSEVVAEVAPAGTEDSKAHAEAAPKKEERRKSPSLLAKLLAPFKNEKTKVKKKVKTPKTPKEKKKEQPEAAASAATAVEDPEPSEEEATAPEAAPEVPTEVPKEEVKEEKKEEKAPKAEVATQPKVDEYPPKIDEPTPIAPHLEGSSETQTIGVGGDGGQGGGFNPPRPLTSIDEARKADVPDLDADTFCTKYHLDKEICDLLNKHGYETADSLLDSDLSLKELGFKVGHVAELKWALNTMLLETFGTIGSADAKGDSTPAISGGTGGGGGEGGQRGGDGGPGEPPRIGIKDAYRFRGIRGGTGGPGGPGGSKIGLDGTTEEIKFQQQAAKEVATTNEEESLPDLFGGVGGPGGWGTHEGGRGGLGEADHLLLEEVSVFRSITGGYGGFGGGSEIRGGHGGIGQGSKFPKRLLRIDEDTRRLVPHTTLENLKISAELQQLLRGQGFRTVGGLLEAYDTDVAPPDFKAGHVGTLRSALRKFVEQKKKEQLAPLQEGLVNPSPDLPTPELDKAKAKASRTILITQRYSRGQSKPTYFGTVGN